MILPLVLIAAADEDYGIGRQGGIPWHYPEDYRKFRQATLGRWVALGRATVDSIGRALPGRVNVMVSRSATRGPDGVLIARSLDDACRMASRSGADRLMVAGGEELYREAIGSASEILLTRIPGRHGCDRRFPIPDPSRWMLRSSEPGNLGLVFEHWIPQPR